MRLVWVLGVLATAVAVYASPDAIETPDAHHTPVPGDGGVTPAAGDSGQLDSAASAGQGVHVAPPLSDSPQSGGPTGSRDAPTRFGGSGVAADSGTPPATAQSATAGGDVGGGEGDKRRGDTRAAASPPLGATALQQPPDDARGVVQGTESSGAPPGPPTPLPPATASATAPTVGSTSRDTLPLKPTPVLTQRELSRRAAAAAAASQADSSTSARVLPKSIVPPAPAPTPTPAADPPPPVAVDAAAATARQPAAGDGTAEPLQPVPAGVENGPARRDAPAAAEGAADSAQAAAATSFGASAGVEQVHTSSATKPTAVPSAPAAADVVAVSGPSPAADAAPSEGRQPSAADTRDASPLPGGGAPEREPADAVASAPAATPSQPAPPPAAAAATVAAVDDTAKSLPSKEDVAADATATSDDAAAVESGATPVPPPASHIVVGTDHTASDHAQPPLADDIANSTAIATAGDGGHDAGHDAARPAPESTAAHRGVEDSSDDGGGVPLPALEKLVEKCSFTRRLNAAQASTCKLWKHQLAVRRRLARWNQQRRDAMESVMREDGSIPQRTHSDLPRRDGSTLNYQDFFLRHALDVVPLVLEDAPVIPDTVDASPLRACGVGGCGVARVTVPSSVGDDNSGSVISSLRKLKAQLRVPAIAFNDFLQRLSGVADTTGSPAAMTAANKLATRWPQVFSADHVALHTSPDALHRIVAPLAGRVRVLVVDGEQRPFFYPFANGSFPPDVDVFHPNTTKYPALHLLSPGDVLFIPSGAAVAWHSLSDDGDLPVASGHAEHAAVVLEHCFLDASNLNRVRSHLMVEGLVSDEHHGMLTLLQAPALDTTVSRVPRELSYADFTSWPRPPAPSATPTPFVPTPQPTPDDGLGGGAAQLDVGAKPAPRRQNNRANRGKGARARRANRLKDWQEERRWAQRIRQLAMPAPSTPLIHSVGRCNVTLRFHCPHEGRPDSHTHGEDATTVAHNDQQPVLGYSVVWHAHRMGDEFGGKNKPGLGHVPVQHGHTHDASARLVDTDVTAHSLLDFGVHSTAKFMLDSTEADVAVGCGGIDPEVLCVTVPNLQPNHLYVFRVAAMTELGTSTYSESSPTARTHVLTTSAPPNVTIATPKVTGAASVRLFLAPPCDDGGLPVTAYVVARQVNWLGPYSQHVVAAVPTPDVHGNTANYLDLSGLVPATGYRFRVAAVNVAGIGQYSEPSMGVTTDAVSAGHATAAVLGFGGVATSEVDALVAKSDPDGYVREAAQALVSSLNDPMLTLQVVLDRSGFGVGPGGFGLPGPGHADSSGASPEMAMPCLGPIVTVSDTRQEVEVIDAKPWVAVGWSCHHSPRQYDVKAELVASKPLSGKGVVNKHRFARRVVYFDRGAVSLRDKVRLAAEAGALAVIIGDTSGRCDNGYTQVCVPGGDKRHGEGFARTDSEHMWKDSRLPALIVDGSIADQLRKLLA